MANGEEAQKMTESPTETTSWSGELLDGRQGLLGGLLGGGTSASGSGSASTGLLGGSGGLLGGDLVTGLLGLVTGLLSAVLGLLGLSASSSTSTTVGTGTTTRGNQRRGRIQSDLMAALLNSGALQNAFASMNEASDIDAPRMDNLRKAFASLRRPAN